ncbi:MAG: ComEA family DNA-binding protein [Myxococcales bacterium]|nr:ComEA family DNA-binding protein [Myxococcales bacterium]
MTVRAELPARPMTTQAAQATSPQPSGPGVVNINEATADQLERLPGVGPSRAQAIIQFRKTHPFKRPEELQRVKGLGKKSWNRLRPLIALTGPTTLSSSVH